MGGCSSLIEHGVTGYLYQADAPYMLAYYVCKIFENKELSVELGNNAALRAEARYDREVIVEDIINCYESMLCK